MKEKDFERLIEDSIKEFSIDTDVAAPVMERIEQYESSPEFSWTRLLLYPLLIVISSVSIWMMEKLFDLARPELLKMQVNILFTKFTVHGIFFCIILVMIFLMVQQFRSLRPVRHTAL